LLRWKIGKAEPDVL
jgi:hypothetical protein